MLGIFVFPCINHRNLTWTNRFFNVPYVNIRMRACTPIASQHNIFNSEKLSVLLCSWRRRGSTLRSLDLESDTLPTEPPRHPLIWSVCALYKRALTLTLTWQYNYATRFFCASKGVAVYHGSRGFMPILTESVWVCFRTNARIALNQNQMYWFIYLFTYSFTYYCVCFLCFLIIRLYVYLRIYYFFAEAQAKKATAAKLKSDLNKKRPHSYTAKLWTTLNNEHILLKKKMRFFHFKLLLFLYVWVLFFLFFLLFG